MHAWESHQLLREAEATGATAMPVVAAVARRATAPDAPAALEDLQLVPLLSNTTWPFCGTRLSTLDVEVSIMAHQLFMQVFNVYFQPYCSGSLEHVSYFFDPSRLCSLLPDDRALHTGDFRPREVDAGDLPPHVAGATNKHGRRDEQTSRRLELAGPPYPIAPRPVASDRASPDAPQRHRPPRPPKLGSRDKRALHEQRPADESQVALRLEMDVWFEMDVDMEGVPNGALPWPLRAGPSSDTSEESDGWRRELDDSEVAESYMDAKFGGEDADMVEIVGGW